jgi:hypothetical protein
VLGEQEKEDPIPEKATFTESIIGEETLRNLAPGATTTVQTLLNRIPSVFADTAGPNGMRTDIKFRAFVDGQFARRSRAFRSTIFSMRASPLRRRTATMSC